MMVSHLTPYSLIYRETVRHLEELGLSSGQALGFVYRTLVQQATLWAYVDNFRLLGVVTLACLPFVLLFRKSRKRARTPVMH